MAFYIFDFDGTLAEISHRRHHLEGPKPQWDRFFEDCDKDEPIPGVIAVLLDLLKVPGNRIEIWSGRSAAVEEKSRLWLARVGVPSNLLKRMRPVGDFTPDDKLKAMWLEEERSRGNEPTVIFDDRQKVVDMWRKHNVECFQVNPGDFDNPTVVNPNYVFTEGKMPILTILIGPAGAGKTTAARNLFDQQCLISADTVRKFLTGSAASQDRNKDVWIAITEVIKARMRVGLPTILDATNIKRKDRVVMAKLTPPGMACAYVIVNRPLEEIEATGGKRNEIMRTNRKGETQTMVQKHAEVFSANLKDIRKGDDLPFVRVFESIHEYAQECDLLGAQWAQRASSEAIAAQ